MVVVLVALAALVGACVGACVRVELTVTRVPGETIKLTCEVPGSGSDVPDRPRGGGAAQALITKASDRATE